MSENNGILSMPAEQYFAANGISKSMLDDIAPEPWGGCPALYYARHVAKTVPSDSTPATRLGSIVHRVVLEPDSLSESYHVKPDGMSFAAKEGKAWRAEHSDREIVTHDEWTAAVSIRDSAWNHKDARRLIEGATTERSLFAKDADGTLRKARLDAIPLASNALADVKTSAEVSPREFEKSIWDYRYFVQAAYYLDIAKLCGVERSAFAFIVAQKEPPFLVSVYQMDPEIIEIGRMIYTKELAEIRQRTETNDWPGFPTQIVGIPEFARKQLEGVI